MLLGHSAALLTIQFSYQHTCKSGVAQRVTSRHEGSVRVLISGLRPVIRRYAQFALLVLPVIAVLAGCGYKSSTTTTTTATTQISSITVTPPASSITVGQNQPFTATVKNSDGTVLSGGVLTWSSSATSVATVDSAGIATGVAPGSTQITATSEGVSSSAVTLNVTPKVASVTISAPTNTVAVGSSTQLSAVAKDASGNVIQNAAIQWASTASSVATIDNTGLVKAVAPGTVMITASSGGVLSMPLVLTVQ
jgi:uncharacterized protein YjdB